MVIALPGWLSKFVAKIVFGVSRFSSSKFSKSVNPPGPAVFSALFSFMWLSIGDAKWKNEFAAPGFHGNKLHVMVARKFGKSKKYIRNCSFRCVDACNFMKFARWRDFNALQRPGRTTHAQHKHNKQQAKRTNATNDPPTSGDCLPDSESVFDVELEMVTIQNATKLPHDIQFEKRPQAHKQQVTNATCEYMT